MYAIALIRYRRPFDEVAPVVDSHRAYLRELHASGVLLAAGPLHPRSGGALLLRVPDDGTIEALDKVRDNDPYVKNGVAQYELQPWDPVIGRELLDVIKL